MKIKNPEEIFSPIEFFKGLDKHFRINKQPNKYLCPASLLLKKISIHSIVFDEWLHLKHGNYEKKYKLSMSEFIKKEYGAKAETFIRKYLK